ncbi:OmpL47-type beta-barrel domain-containing protein [Herbiconiux ginsengi]|nr:Ig-like domain-containing protein [Herbiconiux ginsengi]
MAKHRHRRATAGAITSGLICAAFLAGAAATPAAAAPNDDLGFPVFTGSADPVPATGVTYDTHNELGAIFANDLATGAGSSTDADFWFDKMLVRTGTAGSFGDNNQWMFSRGKAVFMKEHDPSVLGFGGQVAYWEAIDGQGAYSITVSVDGTPVSLTEKTAERKQTPSYWRSVFGTSDSGLTVVETKYITDGNVAVTGLELRSSGGAKTVRLVATSPYATTAEGDELTGVVPALNDVTTIHPRFSGDGMTVADGSLTGEIAVPAGGSASTKVQLGFITPEIPSSTTEYDAYRAAAPGVAYTTHVTDYNEWWADNVPYLDTPEDNIDKTLFYRWWLMRFNFLDANAPGNTFQFPTAVEGVLGYNNAIVLTSGMFIDDLKYFRDPSYSYGTWVSAGEAAKSAKYVDNPGDPANWSNSYTQYISDAAWRSYQLHGGPTPIAESLGTYAENDVEGLIAAYDTDKDGLIDYNWGAMTGNDADAVSFDERPGASMDRTENAYLYANALAAASAYAAAGDTANADQMRAFAQTIKEKVLDLLWDDGENLFKHRFTSDGQLAKWKEINNYYPFSVGLVPQKGDADHADDYEDALRLFADDSEYSIFPFYTANQADKKEAAAAGFPGSNNFSIINSTVLFRLFSSVLRNYDTDAITADSYKKLLYWNAWAQYQNGGDNRLPDQNEFWADGSADPASIGYRSWIHHTILGGTNFTMIEDTMGLRSRDDDKIELDPIDIDWDHFTANDIRFRDRDLTITWDQPGGEKYYGDSVPEGYSVFLDGQLAFTVDELAHVVYDPETGTVTADDGVAVTTSVASPVKEANQVAFTADDRVTDVFAKAGKNIDSASASSTDLAAGATASATYSANGRAASNAVDGTTINEPFWGTAGSPNAKDTLTVDLGSAKTFDDLRVYFYQSSTTATVAGYSEPQSYLVEYLDGDTWKTVPAQARMPQYPQANYNRVQFPEITAQQVRVTVTHAPGLKTGIKEIDLYSTGIAAPESTNAAPFVDAYVDAAGSVPGITKLTGVVKDDGLPGDAVISSWSTVSGPDGGEALFSDVASPSTTAQFTVEGEYVLRLTATDGEKTTTKDLTVQGGLPAGGVNVAPAAKVTASQTASWNSIAAVQDGVSIFTGGAQTALWGTWSGNRPASQWLQYDWTTPQRLDKVGMSFWRDTNGDNAGDGVALPKSWKLEAWDGSAWSEVSNPSGYGRAGDAVNSVTFDAVTTTKLRATFTASTDGTTNAAVGVSEFAAFAQAPESIDPIAVRTAVGTVPTLPATVSGVYADGSRADLAVTWPVIDPSKVAAEGSFVVNGIASGASVPAVATIWVRATPPGQITTVDPVAVHTTAGRAPSLPGTVTVQYNDGSRESGIAVDWADIDPASYAAAGTFTVSGTVAGSPQDATATVSVTGSGSGADTTKPVASIAQSPVQPSNGWYTGAVTITASATDDRDAAPAIEAKVDTGAWAAYAAPISLTADGTHTVSVRATDAAGNVSAEKSVTVKIDQVAPAVQTIGDDIARTVKLSASDAVSGVATLEYRIGDTGDWTAYTKTIPVGLPETTVWARATDTAGTSSEPVSVTLRASTGDSHRNVALWATPTASGTAAWNSVNGLNDDVAPTKSGDVSPDDNAHVWGVWPEIGTQWVQYDWAEPVTVDQTGAYFVSNLDGAGLGIDVPASWKAQYLDADTGEWVDVQNPSEYGTAIDTFNTVTFDEVTTKGLRLQLEASGTVSGAGSVGIKEWQVFEATPEAPDTEAPVVTTNTTPVEPASGWFTGDVSVSAAALDNRDGAPKLESRVGDGEWATYTAPIAVIADGSTAVRFRATDAAGNVSEESSVVVARDTVAPEPSAAFDADPRVVTLAATDAASGVAAIEYRLGDGAWTPFGDPVAVGDEAVTLTYRASDVAGNVSGIGSYDVPEKTTTPPTDPPSTDPPTEGIGVTGNEKLFIGASQVAPGSSVQVTVTGGNPGAVFALELHSSPVHLGTVTVGADGTGTVSVTIPAYTESGTHELWAILDGTVITAPIVVVAPGASTGEHLPNTGMEAATWQPAIVAGIAALVLGAGLAAAVWLRRRTKGGISRS